MIINMNGAKAPETPSPVLQEKTVTPETLPTVIGADEGYDGLSQVTVNPDSQLKAENIRSGKTIFGVEGSFVGEEVSVDLNPAEITSLSFYTPSKSYTTGTGYFFLKKVTSASATKVAGSDARYGEPKSDIVGDTSYSTFALNGNWYGVGYRKSSFTSDSYRSSLYTWYDNIVVNVPEGTVMTLSIMGPVDIVGKTLKGRFTLIPFLAPISSSGHIDNSNFSYYCLPSGNFPVIDVETIIEETNTLGKKCSITLPEMNFDGGAAVYSSVVYENFSLVLRMIPQYMVIS